MKLKIPHYLLLATLSFGAYAQVPPSEPTIHPDLITQDVIDFESINAQVDRALNQLSSSEDLVLQDVGVPDYKVAHYALQSQIAGAVGRFFDRLDGINVKLKQDLSRIHSLNEVKKKYNSPEWDEAYFLEVANLYPSMKALLETEYKLAVKKLYTLEGYLNLKVTNSIDIFREKNKNSLNLPGCETKICTDKLTEDISEWVRLVHAMDQGVKFSTPLGKGQENLIVNGMDKKINRFSMAITSFMKKHIGLKLKDNKVYTNGSAAVDYVKAVGSSAAGISSGILYLPALVLDKVINFSQSLSNTNKFIFTELSVSKVRTYPIDDAVNDYLYLARKERQKYRNVAIGEEEIGYILSTTLDSTIDNRLFILEAIKKDQLLFELIKKYRSDYFPHGLGQSSFEEFVNNLPSTNQFTCQLSQRDEYCTSWRYSIKVISFSPEDAEKDCRSIAQNKDEYFCKTLE